MAEDSFNPEAKSWIDNVNLATGMSAGWRLEFLGKRYKPNRKPAANRAPLKIRRFVRGLPWALVHDAIRYLMSQAPYSGIIYNGVKIPGEFRPTSTRWVRDDQERVDGQATGSYTLVQDLIEDGVTDEFSTPSGGSCSEEVVTEWRWDDPEVVDVNTLPEYGHQGVSYSIQAVRRDEAGGFEYAIVKRKAKTQFSGWVTTECTEFETVETATWDNVYGGIGGDPYITEPYEGAPEACTGDKGVTVALNITENSDCTFKITAQRRTSKTVKTETVSSRTVFETTNQASTQATSALADAPSASGGTYYTRESKLRPDGLYDVSEKKVKETAKVKSRTSVRKTLRGVIKSTTERNTTNDSTTVSNVGDEVVLEKTPGGLWNRTVTEVESKAAGVIANDCEKDVFTHQDSTTINQKSKGESHTKEPGGGKTYSTVSRQNDEGTWDVVTKTTTEISQPNTRVSKRKTLRGVVTTRVDRNSSTSTVVVSKVGDEVSIEKTPGGLWNRTTTEVESEPIGKVAQESTATVFERSSSVTENKASEPTIDVVAGGGFVRTNSARMTEEGTWDVTDKATQEVSYPSSFKQVKNVGNAIVTIERSRNSSSNNINYNPGAGCSTSYEVTPGGMYNTEKVSVVPSSGAIEYERSKSKHVTVTSVTNGQSTPNTQLPQSGVANQQKILVSRLDPQTGVWECQDKTITYSWATADGESHFATESTRTTVSRHATDVPSGGGENYEVTAEPDDYGGFTTRKTTYDPKSKEKKVSWVSTVKSLTSELKYKHTLHVFKNLEEPPEPPSGGDVSVNVSINRYGLYDGYIQTSTLTDWIKVKEEDGGQRDGTMTVYQFKNDAQGRLWKRQVQCKTRAFIGTGNEGTEASTAANAISFPGVSLGRRCYITSVSFGGWEKE